MTNKLSLSAPMRAGLLELLRWNRRRPKPKAAIVAGTATRRALARRGLAEYVAIGYAPWSGWFLTRAGRRVARALAGDAQ